MVDLNRALRTAAQTGEVKIGTKSAREAAGEKAAKAVVLSRNLPTTARESVLDTCNEQGIPIIEFQGTNVELGPALGKPFAVAAAAIIDPGESDILQAAKR